MSDFAFQCCAKCVYNSYYGDRVTAECHRYPPENAESSFRELPASEWCGEYKEGTAYQQPGVIKP